MMWPITAILAVALKRFAQRQLSKTVAEVCDATHSALTELGSNASFDEAGRRLVNSFVADTAEHVPTV